MILHMVKLIVEEPVEEPVFEMASYDIEQTVDDVANDVDQPPDNSTQPKDKASKQDWFKQPPRPPTPDPELNKRQVVVDQPEQPWFNQMVFVAKDPLTFDELMATPIDFSKYAMNRLKIDILTQAHLVGPVYELLKGTCTSIIELPLLLKGCPGRLTLAAEYFFNNDLEFLNSLDPENKYTTSTRRLKQLGIRLWELKTWSLHSGVLPKLGITKLLKMGSSTGVKSVSFGYLEEIDVRRADRQVYKFKEGDFVDLHLNDIEDMLLLAVQHKLFQLNGSDIVDLIVALRMFTRSLIIKHRVEDLQLGVESYQKKLNITKPQKTFPLIEFKELYTPSYKPLGVIYEDLNKQKRVMRADELYKFSNGTLNTIRDELHHRIFDFSLGYNKEMSKRK
ncbi:hypothetical protein Tco_1057202 [Tanacetum coccineum]|uniref:Uncharacterized protein n=1 Tax=Tanacetum coccineum TaxID=301880 RepID=A0ABQ5H661_9ASTR